MLRPEKGQSDGDGQRGDDGEVRDAQATKIIQEPLSFCGCIRQAAEEVTQDPSESFALVQNFALVQGWCGKLEDNLTVGGFNRDAL